MKKIILTLTLFFLGCEQKPQPNLQEVISQIQKNQKPNAPKKLIEEANGLLDRSRIYGYKLITPQDLYARIQNKEALQILDGSPKGEYLLGHIEGAKHLKLPEDLKAPLQDAEKAELTKKLGPNRLIPIIIYDAGKTSGVSPADLACIWAKQLGYTRVYRLIGGMQAWRSENLPTTQEMPSCCH